MLACSCMIRCQNWDKNSFNDVNIIKIYVKTSKPKSILILLYNK